MDTEGSRRRGVGLPRKAFKMAPKLMFSFVDPDMLNAKEYAQYIGPPPYTSEQCRKLRDKMRAEGYDENHIVRLVGDGGTKPTGTINAPQ